MTTGKKTLTLPVIGTCLCLFISTADVAASDDLSTTYVKRSSWAETMLANSESEMKRMGKKAQAVADPVDSKVPLKKISIDVSGCRTMRLVSALESHRNRGYFIWGDAELVTSGGKRVALNKILRGPALNTGRILNKNSDEKGKSGVWIQGSSDLCYNLEGKYVRFEAWAGVEGEKTIAEFRIVLAEPNSELWKRISADFPLEAKWFEEDYAGTYLAWFVARNPLMNAGGILHALTGKERTTPAKNLMTRMDKMKRSSAKPQPLHWLTLYLEARYTAEIMKGLDTMWLTDLRQAVEVELATLTSSGAQVDKLRALYVQYESLARRFPKCSRPVKLEELCSTLATMSKAAPKHFTSAKCGLQTQVLRKQTPIWKQAIHSAVKDRYEGFGKLLAVGKEIDAHRDGIMRTWRGMDEFLKAEAFMDEEWASQYKYLTLDIRDRKTIQSRAAKVLRKEALIHIEDRDPVDVAQRRTIALLADIKPHLSTPKAAEFQSQLGELLSANKVIAQPEGESRFLLFAKTCLLRRQIAFANPLLDFEKILFIKRHRALYDHMTDQFYGIAARPGGGLYVLNNAFSPKRSLRNVLADSVVQRGRLKGQKISGGKSTPPPVNYDGRGTVTGPDHDGGAFLSPDISYDAKKIVFSYVEARGGRKHLFHFDASRGHWDKQRSFHVFKVNTDGSGLEQLTDGTWNDTDPCFLPNDRIAFISERRGGYLRCGRICPISTLYDMKSDGSDIFCLSFHEVDEYHPSVLNDGRILYTRWDYIDRHFSAGHHLWTTYPDGRDPRTVYGNFTPRDRRDNARTDVEMDGRAIPNSHKLVATAVPHHGQAFGSLVVIDPRITDDDAMAPMRRLTPEIGFPESTDRGGGQVYGTAWPLSENYHLCVYDDSLRSVRWPGLGNYGIYLIDAFGNKELIYRDPEISCLNPMPVRPREVPPIIPESITRNSKTANPEKRDYSAGITKNSRPEGTVTVLNVYDSLLPFPKGTQIKALRVIQVLPMPSHNPARSAIHEATRSATPARWVLGTAPVEKDGSAHFTVPANRQFYFQALDQDGMAVQSERTGTYVHENEHLTCLGCHEPKNRNPQPRTKVALALRRAPSQLSPDVDGSRPFSYPILVQPVLDRNCVKCHTKNHKKKAPSLLGRTSKTQRGWYPSYKTLVNYAFTDYGDLYRTRPGKIGARVSKLYQMLKKGHHDLKLSREDMYRLTLWMDCGSLFYGVWEPDNARIQEAGKVPTSVTLE